MQNPIVLLREAEEALIQFNLVKARVKGEFAMKFALEEGANNSAKKRKVLTRLATKERKAVSNMDSSYRNKLFAKPTKKKKAADKGKSDKEAKPKDKTLFLASKRVSVMPRKKTSSQYKVKIRKINLKKILENSYLENIANEEFPAIPAVAKVKNILVITEEAVGNQIIYTPKSAAAALDAAV